MRKLAPLLVIAACSGPAKAPQNAAPPTGPVAEIPAVRWVPAHPTYVFAAPKLRDAQRAARATIDSLGMLVGVDSAEAGKGFQELLALDPLTEAAATQVGIDLDGSIAAFSEELEPTFVLHLTAPDALQQFLGKQREHGMVTQSVQVDGIEVFSAKLAPDLSASWAIDHDWLWVHFGAPAAAAAWFEHSHRTSVTDTAEWAADWAWAKAHDAKSSAVRGFVKLHDLAVAAASRARSAAACARLIAPIARAGFSIDADLHGASGRISLDLGPSAKELSSHLLAPPPGWAAAAGNAAIAIEMNVDSDAVLQWIEPCTDTIGLDARELTTQGIRAGRAMLLSLDPDEPSGTGAVAVDLVKKDAIASLLDQIPMRSHVESSRKFGVYAGFHVAVPFVIAFDYVLQDHLAIAAMGDGVLAQLGANPASPPPPPRLFALDLHPAKLSAKAWEWLLGKVGVPGRHKLVERMQKWQDGHIALEIDGDALVLDLAGHLR